LGGQVDDDDNPLDSIHLLEFVETAICGEVVDYLASKTAFNPRHKASFLERKFGDNMGDYSAAKKREHHHHRRHHVSKGKKSGMMKVATLGIYKGPVSDEGSAESYESYSTGDGGSSKSTVDGDAAGGAPAEQLEMKRSKISTE